MSSSTKRCLAAGLCLAGATPWIGATSRADEAKPVPAAPVSQKQVEALALPVIEGDWCAGMVVAVITPQRATYYGFGSTGLTKAPLDERTVFEIGSISKAFTGLLLADAVERKEVGLDDPISNYLPDQVKAPDYQGTPITLLNLSTHTAALPRLPDNLRPKDPTNPYADYAPQQLYDFLSGYRLTRKPGERSDYSNLGAGLLGHLLARRAGKTYEELLVERVCGPLGLADTRITLSADQRSRLAQGHSVDGEVAPNWDLPTLAGAGALRSSATDMVHFVQANLEPSGSPLASALRMTQAPRFVVEGETSIGLGWHLNTQSKTVWHNGQTAGYHSFAGFIPECRAGVVVLANSATDLVDAVGVNVLRIQEGLPIDPIKLRPTLKLEAKALEPYVGSYTLAPGAILSVTRSESQLKAQLTGQPAFKIYPETASKFYYRVVDAQLTFEKDKDGKVTAVVLYQNGQNLKAPRAK